MENEKDRFGEKMPFVERANEDFYFAARDRELIEEMKAHLQQVETVLREGQIVSCPKCRGKLESYKFMEFFLDRCESCEGIWLDKGELEAILRRASLDPLDPSWNDVSPKMKRKRASVVFPISVE